MDIKTAQKVSDLLKEKIKFETDLASILSKDRKFVLATSYEMSMYGPNSLNISNDLSFNEGIKNLTIQKLKLKIEEIQLEINNISCF